MFRIRIFNMIAIIGSMVRIMISISSSEIPGMPRRRAKDSIPADLMPKVTRVLYSHIVIFVLSCIISILSCSIWGLEKIPGMPRRRAKDSIPADLMPKVTCFRNTNWLKRSNTGLGISLGVNPNGMAYGIYR